MMTLAAIIAVLIIIALGLFVFTIKTINKAADAIAQAEYERNERQRSERMANEMLKEKSREDVARDLDNGSF